MVSSLSKLPTLSCESCQFGKHVQSSFPYCVICRDRFPFVLVHSDVWGLCHGMPTLESRYFVTFIEDYSWQTWLFLMVNRSELFWIFTSFYQEIKNNLVLSFPLYRMIIPMKSISTIPKLYGFPCRGVKVGCPPWQAKGMKYKSSRISYGLHFLARPSDWAKLALFFV